MKQRDKNYIIEWTARVIAAVIAASMIVAICSSCKTTEQQTPVILPQTQIRDTARVSSNNTIVINHDTIVYVVNEIGDTIVKREKVIESKEVVIRDTLRVCNTDTITKPVYITREKAYIPRWVYWLIIGNVIAILIAIIVWLIQR